MSVPTQDRLLSGRVVVLVGGAGLLGQSFAKAIAEGATPIPANFIVNGRVKGFIVNESNQRVTPVVEAICRVRR